MTNHREDWQPLLAELQRRSALAESMGGAQKVSRQHSRGRLDARARIGQLYDAGTFSEYGQLAGTSHPGGEPPLAGDGVVGGTGQIDGRPVVVIAEDATVKGGSIGHVNAAKRARLVRLALEQRLPLVLLLDGAGERSSNQTERYPNSPGDLQLLADLQGRVPVVALVLGVSAGHGALCALLADLVIMAQDAAMFSAGPPLVKAALGIEVTAQELGSAQMHASASGVAHNTGTSEQDCFAMARHFLSLLPQHARGTVPLTREQPGAAARRLDTLLDIIPTRTDQAYDMREVIAVLVDADTLLETQPGYGRTIITAFARIGGTPCLVLANQPAVLAGAITREAAEKATHFMHVGSNFGLPLVSLLDNPGVMPGPDAERSGVLRAAAGMFVAQRRYRGAKIVATLPKAFGFGSSVMGMNPWDRQVISLALPGVSLGGVPAIGGAAAAHAGAEEAARLERLQSGAWVAADAMAFDKIIDPAELRNEIISALRSASAVE